MDLFTSSSDLDLSVNFSNDMNNFPRNEKISALGKLSKMKAWAKAHDINSSKDHTMNSLSIIALVAFHLQVNVHNVMVSYDFRQRSGIGGTSVHSMYHVGKTRTARYILVRQLTGTQIDRYRVVPLRSAVGDRFRPSTVNFHRRWSVSVVCGRFISGRLRKKKERRRRRKEEEEEYLAPP
ncbi:hypothetical protein BHM03_00021325 [Ensete ventricosum]|nr:hypothetical protein BHM03_00021325 [Ensete ventricosum]